MDKILNHPFFNRKSMIFSTLSIKGKREWFFYRMLQLFFFVFAIIIAFPVINAFSHFVYLAKLGSATSAFFKMLPAYLVFLSFVYIVFFTDILYHATSQEKRIKGWKIHGLILLGIGVFSSLLTLINLFTKQYQYIVEGYPTSLFPLDILLVSIGLAVVGYFAYRYSNVLVEKPSQLPTSNNGDDKIIYYLDKILYFVFLTSAIIAINLFFKSFANLLWTEGGVFYNITLMLLLLATASMFIYEEICKETVTEYKNNRQYRGFFAFIIINIIVFGAHLISMLADSNVLIENASGLLVLDMSMKAYVFPILFGLVVIFSPLFILIKNRFAPNDELSYSFAKAPLTSKDIPTTSFSSTISFLGTIKSLFNRRKKAREEATTKETFISEEKPVKKENILTSDYYQSNNNPFFSNDLLHNEEENENKKSKKTEKNKKSVKPSTKYSSDDDGNDYFSL